jgi:serine/threonine-protein kinase RsbW
MNAVTPCEIELRIPCRADCVRVARMAALAIASELSLNYDDMKDVELAVGEACANAVEHASGSECSTIVVRFALDPKGLIVEVIDRGPGFDVDKVAAEGSEGAPYGGLGLSIMRSVMDEVEIICDAQSGTCVRMTKYRAT